MEQSPFNDLTLTFATLKKKVLAMSASDMPSFRDTALYFFVADMLDWFQAFPDLDVVRVEHRISIESRGAFNVALSTTHSVNLSAPAAGMDRASDPLHHDEYVAERLPFTVWGPGEFEIYRSDFRIQRFLALTEDDVLEWSGLVAGIARQMDQGFGQVRQVHALNA